MDLFPTLSVYVFILLALIFSGVPIAFALGLLAVGSVYFGYGPSLMPAFGHVTWGTTVNFVLGAIPLFVFMGFLTFETGLSTRIYGGIAPLLSRLLPGGILFTNIVVGAIFAACSGSSSASCATIGSVALPEMEKQGYEKGIASGSVGAAGALGILIPPSVVMIIYGAMTEVSIGKLFIGGIIPGIILTLVYLGYIGIRLAIHPQLAGEAAADVRKLPWKACLWRLLDIAPVIILIVAVLGSIYAGVATPTEAAAVGCAVVLILAASYRLVNLDSMRRAISGAVRVSSMILLIFLGASLMGIYLSNVGITMAMAKWVVSLDSPPLVTFMAIAAMYVVLGMLMDCLAAIVMTLPITFPIVMGLGFDPVWYGIVLVLLGECGLLSPPVGLNLFVLQGLRPSYPFLVIVKGCLPFFLLIFIVIFLVVLFPELITFLPETMIGF